MRDFEETLSAVRRRIAAACARAGRNPDEVKIVAVTKTHGPETVAEAWQAGLSIIGENKVREAQWKRELSPSGPEWHLIGHLQTNKVRQALATFDFIHSVDSLRLVERLQAVAEEIGAQVRMLIEVNVSGESSKTGLPPAQLDGLIAAIAGHCPRLSLEGLMGMAPYAPDPEAARPYFRRLRELRDAARERWNLPLEELSMGMSGDYEVAVEEGATMVRLGTVLFGDRPKLRPAASAGDEPAGGGLDSYSGAGPTVRILD